jgi:hypothetical protein
MTTPKPKSITVTDNMNTQPNSFIGTLSHPGVFSKVTGLNNATMKKLALCSPSLCALVRTALTVPVNVWTNNMKGQRKPPESNLTLSMGFVMNRFLDAEASLVVYAAANPDSDVAKMQAAKRQTSELIRNMLKKK